MVFYKVRHIQKIINPLASLPSSKKNIHFRKSSYATHKIIFFRKGSYATYKNILKKDSYITHKIIYLESVVMFYIRTFFRKRGYSAYKKSFKFVMYLHVLRKERL